MRGGDGPMGLTGLPGPDGAPGFEGAKGEQGETGEMVCYTCNLLEACQSGFKKTKKLNFRWGLK